MGLIRCLSVIRLTDFDARGSGVLLEGTDARSHSVLCSCAVTAQARQDMLLHWLSEHCQMGDVCAYLQEQLQGALADDASDHGWGRIPKACSAVQLSRKPSSEDQG